MIFEPHIKHCPTILKGDEVEFVHADQAIQSADIVVLLVNHKEFSEISLGDLVNKTVIDTRGMWNTQK